MADTSQQGPQGRKQPGSSDQRNRTLASGPASECGGVPLFPPGPSDADAWSVVLATDPARAPSFARRDIKEAAIRIAALLDPDEANSILQRAGDMEITDLLAEVGKQAGGVVEQTAAFAGLCDLAHGVAERTRALRLLGNGVFPLAAAYAWRTLATAHGLGPVDLVATFDPSASPDTIEPVRLGGVS